MKVEVLEECTSYLIHQTHLTGQIQWSCSQGTQAYHWSFYQHTAAICCVNHRVMSNQYGALTLSLIFSLWVPPLRRTVFRPNGFWEKELTSLITYKFLFHFSWLSRVVWPCKAPGLYRGRENVQEKEKEVRQTYRSVLAVDCRVAVITRRWLSGWQIRVKTRGIDVHVVTYRRVPLSIICMYPYQLSLSAFRRFSPLSSALLSLR